MRPGQFGYLQTVHSTWVIWDEATGEIACSTAHEDAAALDRIVLYALPSGAGALLFSAAGHDAVLLPGSGPTPVHAVGITAAPSGCITLWDLKTAHWLCATPSGAEAGTRGRLQALATSAGPFERLMPHTLDPAGVPRHIVTTAIQTEAALHALLAGAIPPATESAPLACAFKLAPDAVQTAYARELLQAPGELRIAAAAQGAAALTGLADWLMRDRAFAPAVLQIGPEADDLATPWLGQTGWTFPGAVAARIRQAIIPRRTLCVIATGRNEGPYLVDWIAYHRAIGVEQIFLYTNDNDDGSDALLGALHDTGVIRWVRNEVAPGSAAQNKAYAHALSHNPEPLDYEWALILDLDEYLVFDPAVFGSALTLARWFGAQGCDAVAINWQMIGSSGQLLWDDRFIGDRFAVRVGGADRHVKTLFRTGWFVNSTPHYPFRYGGRSFDFRASDGTPHVATADLALSDRPQAQYAWINHYHFKSVEECLAKFSINRGDHPLTSGRTAGALTTGKVRAFMDQFAWPAPPADTLRPSAPGLDMMRRRILAQPRVGAAVAAIHQAVLARRYSLWSLFHSADAIAQAGAQGDAFRALMQALAGGPALDSAGATPISYP